MVDRDAQIIELYRQGLLYVQIAEAVGLSRARVQAICAESGIVAELPRKRGYRGGRDAEARAIIGQRLRAWLVESGKPRSDVITSTGMSLGTFGQALAGRRLISGDHARELERYFCKPEGALYAGTGTRPYKQAHGGKQGGKRCLCCEILLSIEPESIEQAGLCALCVADIRRLQAQGVLRCKNLLAACWEWRELTAPDQNEQLWLDACADDAILMEREGL